MTIAIISEWFSENMGYAENYLPKAFVKLGCRTHVITSDFQIYGTNADLYKIYEPFLGKPIVETGIKEINGFTLHRLPHYQTKYGIGIKNLYEKLKDIKADIVYLFEINNESTLQIVKYKPLLNYKIYAESRLHLSIYTPPKTFKEKIKNHFTERLKWKKVGLNFEKCYPIAPDVLQVICKYFGQNKNKCVLASLAVDSDNFKPIESEEDKVRRADTRKAFGFIENDIVCIYTGRFTDSKGAIILAKAIDNLHRKGKTNFKGLFIGMGDAKYEANISSHFGCIIHPFVQSNELVRFYQLADIGVWPKEESTSQLDAIACGLPIIISSNVADINRITGNGINYKHEDPEDLACKIESLEDNNIRKELGTNGVNKVKQAYSWDHIASLRLKDFNKI